jgi:hypothetical protein
MKQAQVLQAIERIENDIARLQAEAAALRARVSSTPPPASHAAHASHAARKETLAFPSPASDRAQADASLAQSAVEPSPTTARNGSAPRVQHAIIPVDTIPPASRSRSSTRAAKARDTIPVPAPSISEPPHDPVGDDEANGGRYGFVSEPRTKSTKPK